MDFEAISTKNLDWRKLEFDLRKTFRDEWKKRIGNSVLKLDSVQARLVQLRDDSRMTQHEFAELLQSNQSMISKLEKGVSKYALDPEKLTRALFLVGNSLFSDLSPLAERAFFSSLCRTLEECLRICNQRVDKTQITLGDWKMSSTICHELVTENLTLARRAIHLKDQVLFWENEVLKKIELTYEWLQELQHRYNKEFINATIENWRKSAEQFALPTFIVARVTRLAKLGQSNEK